MAGLLRFASGCLHSWVERTPRSKVQRPVVSTEFSRRSRLFAESFCVGLLRSPRMRGVSSSRLAPHLARPLQGAGFRGFHRDCSPHRAARASRRPDFSRKRQQRGFHDLSRVEQRSGPAAARGSWRTFQVRQHLPGPPGSHQTHRSLTARTTRRRTDFVFRRRRRRGIRFDRIRRRRPGLLLGGAEQRFFPQQGAHAIGPDLGRRMQPAKGAHPRKPARQDVLEETPHLRTVTGGEGNGEGVVMDIQPEVNNNLPVSAFLSGLSLTTNHCGSAHRLTPARNPRPRKADTLRSPIASHSD